MSTTTHLTHFVDDAEDVHIWTPNRQSYKISDKLSGTQLISSSHSSHVAPVSISVLSRQRRLHPGLSSVDHTSCITCHYLPGFYTATKLFRSVTQATGLRLLLRSLLNGSQLSACSHMSQMQPVVLPRHLSHSMAHDIKIRFFNHASSVLFSIRNRKMNSHALLMLVHVRPHVSVRRRSKSLRTDGHLMLQCFNI